MSTMLKISEAASLGMHAMLLLAKEPEKVLSTHEAATRLGVSEAHLSKVMQRLAHARVVRSVRGPKGGFLPARPTSDITLLEVYEAIEGPLTDRTCLLPRRICTGDECILGPLLGNVNREMRNYLAASRLSELGLKAVGGEVESGSPGVKEG